MDLYDIRGSIFDLSAGAGQQFPLYLSVLRGGAASLDADDLPREGIGNEIKVKFVE